MASRRVPRDRYHGVYPLSARIYLHETAGAEGGWQISAIGTAAAQAVSNYETLKLAVHGIRDWRTDSAFSFMAAPQLRFRFLGDLWAQYQRRKTQIFRHYGGALPKADRCVVADRGTIELGDNCFFAPSTESAWMIGSRNRRGNPQLTWRQIVHLSVVFLRDAWTEHNFPAQHLAALRTPDEWDAFEAAVRERREVG